MSNEHLLKRMQRVCGQLPAAECPNACGLLRSLELHGLSDTLLSLWLFNFYMYGGMEDMPSLRYAADQPTAFKGLVLQLGATSQALMAAKVPIMSNEGPFHALCQTADAVHEFAHELRQTGLPPDQPLFAVHVLSLLALSPLKIKDTAWQLAAYRCASRVIDEVWGGHEDRQAAGLQLARNGLVPVLPAAEAQAVQQDEAPAARLSPAAAALQEALQQMQSAVAPAPEQAHAEPAEPAAGADEQAPAEPPEPAGGADEQAPAEPPEPAAPPVSLEDLHQWALSLRLFAGVAVQEHLSDAEVAALLTDCQLLLSKAAVVGGGLMAAERAAALIMRRVTKGDRRRQMQAQTLVRLGHLLAQAAERAEADKCWYTAAVLNAYHADALLGLLGVYLLSPQLPQRVGGQDLPAAEVAQQAQQLLQRSCSFDGRLKPWLLDACMRSLVVEREFTEAVVRHAVASGFASLPGREDVWLKQAQFPRCDGCHRLVLHVRTCAEARHWREGGHKEQCAALAEQRQRAEEQRQADLARQIQDEGE